MREYRQTRFQRPPGATEILLVRHGESRAATEDDPFPLVDGHGDPELHPNGRDQATFSKRTPWGEAAVKPVASVTAARAISKYATPGNTFSPSIRWSVRKASSPVNVLR